MSRTLRSTSVKSVNRRSSAIAASRLFVACLSNWVKKKLFFGISDRRMVVLLLGTHEETAPVARSPSLNSAFRQRTVAAEARVDYATSRLMEATAPSAITTQEDDE